MEVIENLNRRYLRIPLREENETGMEGYRSRVLQRNRLVNLLKMDKRYIDGVSYLYYEITAMRTLAESWNGSKITVSQMNLFVDGLERVLQELQEYLLKQEELCLCPEQILLDENSEKLYFLYIPNYTGEQNRDLEKLLEFIMDSIDCSDEEGIERFYSFYNEVIQSVERIKASDLVHLWKKGEKNIVSKKMKKEKGIEETGICKAAICEEEFEEDFMDGKNSIWQGKGKIYSVPYHGIKITRTKDGSLT